MAKHPDTLLILAVPTGKLELTRGLGSERVFARLDSQAAIAQLSAAGAWFGPRPTLEEDESFRQIIPYAVLRCGDKYLTYTRGGSGGEARLHDRISMGFGGHVDLPDMKLCEKGYFDLGATLANSVDRELAEEIPGIQITGQTWIGLLADNTDAVGRVHVGLIGIWDIAAIPETSGEAAIASLKELSAEEVVAARDRLEGWSQVLADNLATL
ncbi:hypothetical protein ACEUZ9_001091 [Paracoccus litorisediminis]|uniref:hypothetical protein n=1 Tax=Paracoccus litorisediminis TaxID=2006130 RepID=UPI003731803D